MTNLKRCKRCWEHNPAQIHTCTTWLHFTKEEKLHIIREYISIKRKNTWYWIFDTNKYIYSQINLWDILHYEYEKLNKKIKKLHPTRETIKKWDKESFNNVKEILKLYKYLRWSIDIQPDECINYIFSFVNKDYESDNNKWVMKN